MPKQRKRTERVNLLIANFHHEFVNKGDTLKEIAERYGVSERYTYDLLPEIAQKNNVSVETYYQKEHGFHVVIAKDGRIRYSASSFGQVEEELKMASDSLGKAASQLAEIEELIKECIQEEEI